VKVRLTMSVNARRVIGLRRGSLLPARYEMVGQLSHSPHVRVGTGKQRRMLAKINGTQAPARGLSEFATS
jgi:hypothetical protein